MGVGVRLHRPHCGARPAYALGANPPPQPVQTTLFDSQSRRCAAHVSPIVASSTPSQSSTGLADAAAALDCDGGCGGSCGGVALRHPQLTGVWPVYVPSVNRRLQRVHSATGNPGGGAEDGVSGGIGEGGGGSVDGADGFKREGGGRDADGGGCAGCDGGCDGGCVRCNRGGGV